MSQVLEQSPLQAGREAISRHAWREGFDLLHEADQIEALGPQDLVGLAEAAWWIGRLDECIAARERAFTIFLEQGDRRAAAKVALALAENYFDRNARSIGAGWFSKAERLLADEPECAEHGYLSMMNTHSAIMMGDFDAGVGSAKRTLEIGTKFGDRDLQAFGLAFQGMALTKRGDVKEGVALLDEATVAAVSGELGPLASGMVFCLAISASSAIADYRRAGEWTEASKRWCERQSIAGFPGICRVHRAEIMRLRGSWAEAESDARRAITELQNFNLGFAAEGFYELGEVRLHTGDLAGAEDAFRQAHELGRDPQPGLAMLKLAEGKQEAARTSIARSLDDPAVDRLSRCRLLPAQVEIAIATGDLTTATTALEELEELTALYDSSVLRASALVARGALQLAQKETGAAIQTLRAAGRLWKEVDLPYEGARTRLSLGIALREDGDEDAASLELKAARSTFEKLGAVLDLRRAMELMGEEVSDALPKAGAPGIRLTKTFMFTDIVSSTNIVEAIGDDAWENVLAWHDDTMRKLFMTHCGEEVKQIGDGFFVAFDQAGEAVECAVDIQRRLKEHRKEHGFAPKVRIGLHSTEATRKGNDYTGKGIHAAARIGALAQGGEILASKPVIQEAKPRFPVSDMRSVELKGVAEPVQVASISLR